MSVTESAPGLIDVYFVLLPDSLVLDWAGPAEALRITNQALMALGQLPRFQLHFVSLTPTSATSVGVMLFGLKPLPLLDENLPCWVVLVGQPGSAISVDADSTRAPRHGQRGWLRRWWWRCGVPRTTRSFRHFQLGAATCIQPCTGYRTRSVKCLRRLGRLRPWPPWPTRRRAT